MNAILEQINSMGQTFVEFAFPMLVQSSVLIVILLLVDFLLRKRVRAVFRYCIWLLVLVKLVLPSSLSSPLSLGYLFGDSLENVTVSSTRTTAEPVEMSQPLEMSREGEAKSVEAISMAPIATPATEGIEPAVEAGGSPMASMGQVTWQGVVFLVWLVVVGAMALLLLQRAVFVRGLVAQAKNANSLMNDAFRYCCRCIGVKGKVGLKVSANATSPAVCGLFKPVILVPQNLGPSLGSSGLRTVLLHELAHIKRGDLWVNLAQTVLQIIYFYNPLLWLANAVIRRVREQAVDETVQVAMGEKAQQYPETLVNVAKLAFKRPALSLRLIGVVESKSALKGRIKHLLNRPIPKKAKLGLLGLAAVVITAAILLPMAKAEKQTDDSDGWITKWQGKDTKTIGIFDGPDGSIGVGSIKEENGGVEIDIYDTYHDGYECRIIAISKSRGKIYTGDLTSKIKPDKGARFNKAIFKDISLKKIKEFKFQIRPIADNKFKATLPNGVTVELVGVCEHPSEGKQWWAPDGQILDKIPYAELGWLQTWTGESLGWGREFAVRVSSDNHCNFAAKTDSHIDDLWVDRIQPKTADGETIKDLRAFLGVFRGNINSGDVGFGVACGPWEKVEEWGPHDWSENIADVTSFQSDKSVILTWPRDYKNGFVVTVTHGFVNEATRLVLTEKNGRHHRIYGDPLGGTASGMERDRYTFLNFKREDIEKFDFEKRPYKWVKFKNVSLKPNFKTDVKVAYRTTVTRRIRQAGKPESGRDETYEFLTEANRKTRLLTPKERVEMDNWVSIVASVVKDSGRYLLPEDEELTLSELIRAAGYDPQKVPVSFLKIRRPVKLGQVRAYSLFSRNLETLFNGKESDPVLKRHDGIVGGWIYPSPNQKEFLARYSFGDVVELTINDDNFENNMFVDLDAGKLVTPDEDLDKKDLEKVLKWMSDNGIDAVCNTSPKVRGLIGYGMVALSVDSYFWNADIPDFWDRLIMSINHPVLLSAKEDLPATYLIESSEHKMGILQILGFTDKPEGVRIRYKLLEKGEIQKTDVGVEVRGRPSEDPMTVGRSDAVKRKEEILTKLVTLSQQRDRIQRDLAIAERALQDVRVASGLTDLEERGYRHPVTERLMRLEQERDNCYLEIAQLKAKIKNLEKRKAAEELINAEDNLVALEGKLKALDRMVQEAKAQKKDLDRARVQYKRRLAIRDERQLMLDSLKAQIEKLRIMYDEAERTNVDVETERR